MGRLTGPQTVQQLLQAAHQVLAEQGRTQFTLNAVVARTTVSKGALLHHFKSMDELARCLLLDAIAEFDALVDRVRDDDRSPGSYTRAYIKATLGPPPERKHATLSRSIVELARDPNLKSEFRRASRRWSQQVERDGLAREVAQLLRLAADGLWLNETADAKPLSAAVRARLIERMLGMATPVPASSAASRPVSIAQPLS